jgi:hypothetical protein
MANVVVLDTETVSGTYGLISVGAIVLGMEGNQIEPMAAYFGFSDEYEEGYYFVQQLNYANRFGVKRKSREVIERDLRQLIRAHGVKTAFAYNAGFDKCVVGSYLPGLRFEWRDLMQPARKTLGGQNHYHKYKKVHPGAELTSNGLLKCCYSVDCVGCYLGLPRETHVAIEDATLETQIAIKLGLFRDS